MANGPAFIEVPYACWHAGLAAVPINAKLHPAEFRYILEHSGARLCFATHKVAEAIALVTADLVSLEALIDVGAAARPAADYRALLEGDAIDMAARGPDNLAWLFYTSGTTGRPKGAMLSHRNLLAMTLSYFADVDTVALGDCILHAAPMSHGSGLYILPHIARGALNVVPESGQFDPPEIFDLLRHHAGVTMFSAPTMVKRLVEHPQAANADGRRLKTVVYGGGPMYFEDLKQAMARFRNCFVQIYGQGESPMTITALSRAEHANTEHPRHEARLASVGRTPSGARRSSPSWCRVRARRSRRRSSTRSTSNGSPASSARAATIWSSLTCSQSLDRPDLSFKFPKNARPGANRGGPAPSPARVRQLERTSMKLRAIMAARRRMTEYPAAVSRSKIFSRSSPLMASTLERSRQVAVASRRG